MNIKMKKINLSSIRIDTEKREVTVSVFAHGSTKYSAIEGYAAKNFKKSREVFRFWDSLNEPTFINYGITNSYPYMKEGYRIYECKFTA
jgi:transcriptional regulator